MSKDDKKKFDYREELLKEIPEEFLPKKYGGKREIDPRTVTLKELFDRFGVFDDIIARIPDDTLRNSMKQFTESELEKHEKVLNKMREHIEDPDIRLQVWRALADRMGK